MTGVARILALGGLLITLVGCQTFDVRTDWDPTTDFTPLQRFHWVEPPQIEGASPFADNSLLRKRVRSAIERALVERGFRAVQDPASADFQVTYSVVLEERLRVDGVSSSGGAYYPRRGGFGTIHRTADVRAYQESTLIVDLLDPGSGDLVWRGWGTGIVGTRDRDRDQARLEKGVRAILDEFPPTREGED
ncbi:MAG: hypothetical protein CL908_11975 [Deltaproteobacteria bacterium]|nr:hypothetical protein [Deltaproteobacteria bacterium]